jgi:HEAT repeat protein
MASPVLLLAAITVAPRPARAIPEESLPQLLHDLVAGTPGQSDRAVEGLRYLGPEVAGPPLRSLLTSQSEHEREVASGALVVIHDRGATHVLEQSLADEDWEVRRNSVNALVGVKDRRAIRLIADTLKKDIQVRVRKSCVTALDKLGGAPDALASASTSDPALEVRLAALDALAHSMDRHVAPHLKPLLEDSSSLVRFAAARSLAWQGDRGARKFLTKAIDSTDAEEIRRGVTALSDVPTGWAVDLLAHALESSDEHAATDAAAALARRQDPRGSHFLVKVATSGGPEAQHAQSWLDRLGPPQTSPAGHRSTP